jgi:hypothetical protein
MIEGWLLQAESEESAMVDVGVGWAYSVSRRCGSALLVRQGIKRVKGNLTYTQVTVADSVMLVRPVFVVARRCKISGKVVFGIEPFYGWRRMNKKDKKSSFDSTK